jgi:hypothetical protein
MAIVASEEVFEERVDFLVLDASELDVLVKGEIAGAAGVSGGMESGDSFELDAVEVVARLRVWHGRRNFTIVGWGCKGTLVLRKMVAARLVLSHGGVRGVGVGWQELGIEILRASWPDALRMTFPVRGVRREGESKIKSDRAGGLRHRMTQKAWKQEDKATGIHRSNAAVRACAGLYFGREFTYHGVLNCSWRRLSVPALAACV